MRNFVIVRIFMYILFSPSIDPHFNLALEEILFREFPDDIIFLYVNRQSIIIGKHQIPQREANVVLAHWLQIPIIRRISGGGTVYHDEGNLNFSFITLNKTKTLEIDFKPFIVPIATYLQKFNLQVYVDDRNNIFIHNKKISGNAQHRTTRKILHHGTLLFQSNLNLLHTLLSTPKHKYLDLSVRSKPAPVTNISEYLSMSIEPSEFFLHFKEFIAKTFSATLMTLDPTLKQKAEELAVAKYRNQEWNWTSSPFWFFQHTILNNQMISFSFFVDTAEIRKVCVYLAPYDIASLLKNLIHLPHCPVHLENKIMLETSNTQHLNDYKKKFLLNLFM